jgi:hypothetical protein
LPLTDNSDIRQTALRVGFLFHDSKATDALSCSHKRQGRYLTLNSRKGLRTKADQVFFEKLRDAGKENTLLDDALRYIAYLTKSDGMGFSFDDVYCSTGLNSARSGLQNTPKSN